MKRRFQDWLAETHGTRFELLRHFLARLFDSDLLATPGEWTRVAIGLVAILFSVAIPLLTVLRFKYSEMVRMGLAHRIPAEVQADFSVLVTLALTATLFLAAALWESLYPSRRDYLALASLPVRPGEVFAAKFMAVCLVFAVFEIVLLGSAAIAFHLGTQGQAGIAPTFLGMASASVAAFFSLVAFQGLLLQVLPTRVFERVSVWSQALLVAGGLAGFWLLPGLRIPATGAMVAPVAAVLAYSWSYRRHRRLLLEVAPKRALRHRDFLGWFLDLSVRDPREQAALLFIWKTLGRSRVHRLELLAFVGLGLAWILTFAASDEPERALVGRAPVALAVFALLGLRYLYSLPVELPANWMFQITEREGRLAWLRAVERFTLCGVAPVLAAGGALVGLSEGPIVAAAWLGLAVPFAAILFEILFRDWRKLPFTCSYLPGKRPLVFTVGLCVALVPALVPVGLLLLSAASNAAGFVALFSIELAAWWWLRRARLEQWGGLPLCYEELPPRDVDSFNLAEEGTIVAQEQFARAWEDHLRRTRCSHP